MNLLTEEFLSKYPDSPAHQNELSAFVFYRTYSRWLASENRRETWKEAVSRAVDYNCSIAMNELRQYKGLLDKQFKSLVIEAETLFDNIFNLRQFLSGRTHWVGGADTGVADKFPLANFNCAFLNITRLDKEQNDLADLFYCLLVGTGVGFKCTKEMARNLPPIRNNVTLNHKPYNPLPTNERIEHTQIHTMDNGYVNIWVGDSKEGWVESLRYYFEILTNQDYEYIHTINFSYNSIRPRKERLKTFGGTASGYEPLMEMYQGFDKVIKNTLDLALKPPVPYSGHVIPNYYVQLRPIHILDMGNLIGNNVVVGGVRRTAEIFLCDEDDWEVIFAKYGINGIWDKEKHNNIIKMAIQENVPTTWIKFLSDMELSNKDIRPLNHRRMSNNSIAFETKPTLEFIQFIFTMMQGEGEPGLVNLEEARRRRPNAEGLNPCAEILLDSYGVCNLTTVNVDAFCILQEDGTYNLDVSGLCQAQALSARAGIRMTCLTLELPHWDLIQKRDRLIGTSLTGWEDAIAKIGLDKDGQEKLKGLLGEVVREQSIKYCHVLRIPTPLVDTTIKPEGTLSQVAGGVSSGLHVSHAPFYIRRIRINSNDTLVKVARQLGWTINPEVGEDPESLRTKYLFELAKYEEGLINVEPILQTEPRTLVIDFPIASGSKKTRNDQTLLEQFDTYFSFQKDYTNHNSSNTISVREDEWQDVAQIVYDNWDNFVGVSFLAHNGGTYLLAPYEEISEEDYHRLKEKMLPFDASLLMELETEQMVEDDSTLEGCEAGACPIR